VVVTAGALLGGIAGAFAAVPVAAVTTAFLQEVHQRSEPANDEGDATPSQPEGTPHGDEHATSH
jgi:predicted PurR-regulated permease PerM